MALKLSIIITVFWIALFSFGCRAQRTAEPVTAVVPVGEKVNVGHREYVTIGAVDFENITRVEQVLDDADIPGGIEGSVLYGISVPEPLADKAFELLSKDSRDFHYVSYDLGLKRDW